MTEPTQSVIPCCPPLEKDTACDVLDFHYRLKHTSAVQHAGRRVQVEVLVHARFERCPALWCWAIWYTARPCCREKRSGCLHRIAAAASVSIARQSELPQRANVGGAFLHRERA